MITAHHCPTCTCPQNITGTWRYAPTGELMTVLGIANMGQDKPTDVGHGERLYRVRFADGSLGQASRGEIRAIK